MELKSLKKNALLNLLKQFLKIAFPLITFPYVSRILLEDNFGKYNFSLSVINYFILIAGLGISEYSVREGARLRDKKEHLANFANEIYTINILSSTFSYLMLLFSVIFVDKLHPYLLLIFIQSMNIVFNTLGADWINIIFEDYEYMTKRYIFVKVLSLIAIFVFVKKVDDYYIYTLIMVGSEVLANVMNIVYVRRYIKLRIHFPCNFFTHIKSLMLLFVNGFAVTVYSNADITMLGLLRGNDYVGVYSVASKVYQIAKGLINSVLIVTIPRLSFYLGKEESNDKYYKLFIKVLKCSLMITLPMAIVMFFLRKEVILILGGKNFLTGALALGVLSIALIPACISSVIFNGVLIPNRGEKYCLFSTFISAFINIFLNYIFIARFGLIGAAISTLIAEIISSILAIIFSYRLFNIKIRIDRDFISCIVASLFTIVSCWCLKNIWSGIMKIIFNTLVGVIVYGIVLILLRNTVIKEIINSFLQLNKK